MTTHNSHVADTNISSTYAVISLDEFAGLDLIVLASTDHGDFVIISAVQPCGRQHTCVQGVLRGQVFVTPPPPGHRPAAAYPSLTDRLHLRS
jgi:hypothetical protein